MAGMEGEGKKLSKHLQKSNPVFHNGEWERKGRHTHNWKDHQKKEIKPPFHWGFADAEVHAQNIPPPAIGQHGQPGLLRALLSAASQWHCSKRCSSCWEKADSFWWTGGRKEKKHRRKRTDIKEEESRGPSLHMQSLVEATGIGGGHSLCRTAKGQCEWESHTLRR